ncbi:uncharacterized protein AMSG_09791 [Thecamonas trahens ATCC 50062]|uniref:BRCT domain-containing protein n=1 Tax=Thecamonas trahens ATCC 50062 TaxID=461836 RepID=A0A0L0DNF4_THETB|nr:hypothetical protein AMSG_09791 [Thecamonas trahens ATCC 50062]KNC53842.1 hypothetical protein AMSG_09791 [Thecamonas trahens ATCC 50062]|eukprot:XP_013754223.1 hypothetical protein AMSG_09791 [Thecamonas trahens ATCC 50062]
MSASKLFTAGGLPMVFYMSMGKTKKQMRELITKHGGRMATTKVKDCIVLVPKKLSPGQSKRVGKAYLERFVTDSVAAGKLLPLSEYAATDKPEPVAAHSQARQPYSMMDEAVMLRFAEAEIAAGATIMSRKTWKLAERIGLIKGRNAEALYGRWRSIVGKPDAYKARLRAIAVDELTPHQNSKKAEDDAEDEARLDAAFTDVDNAVILRYAAAHADSKWLWEVAAVLGLVDGMSAAALKEQWAELVQLPKTRQAQLTRINVEARLPTEKQVRGARAAAVKAGKAAAAAAAKEAKNAKNGKGAKASAEAAAVAAAATRQPATPDQSTVSVEAAAAMARAMTEKLSSSKSRKYTDAEDAAIWQYATAMQAAHEGISTRDIFRQATGDGLFPTRTFQALCIRFNGLAAQPELTMQRLAGFLDVPPATSGTNKRQAPGDAESDAAPAAKKAKSLSGAAVVSDVQPLDIAAMEMAANSSMFLYVDGERNEWAKLATMELSDSDDEDARAALLAVRQHLSTRPWWKNKGSDPLPTPPRRKTSSPPPASASAAAKPSTPAKASPALARPASSTQKASSTKEVSLADRPGKSSSKKTKAKAKAKTKAKAKSRTKAQAAAADEAVGTENRMLSAAEALQALSTNYGVPIATLVRLVFNFNGSVGRTERYLRKLVERGAEPGEALVAKIKDPFSPADDARILMGSSKALKKLVRRHGKKRVDERRAYLQSL